MTNRQVLLQDVSCKIKKCSTLWGKYFDANYKIHMTPYSRFMFMHRAIEYERIKAIVLIQKNR
jgi:hypothetical protein